MSNKTIEFPPEVEHPLVLPKPVGTKQQPQGLKYIKKKRLPAIVVK